MKVKAIKDFYDLKENISRVKGDEWEVEQERFDELRKAKVVEEEPEAEAAAPEEVPEVQEEPEESSEEPEVPAEPEIPEEESTPSKTKLRYSDVFPRDMVGDSAGDGDTAETEENDSKKQRPDQLHAHFFFSSVKNSSCCFRNAQEIRKRLRANTLSAKSTLHQKYCLQLRLPMCQNPHHAPMMRTLALGEDLRILALS